MFSLALMRVIALKRKKKSCLQYENVKISTIFNVYRKLFLPEQSKSVFLN